MEKSFFFPCKEGSLKGKKVGRGKGVDEPPGEEEIRKSDPYRKEACTPGRRIVKEGGIRVRWCA